MPERHSANEPRLQALKSLSEGLLEGSACLGMRGSLLEIRHESSPLLDPVLLHRGSEDFGVSLSLTPSRDMTSGQKVCCESSQLPFQDNAFCTVLLHHVISDGFEPELAEACRVLRRSGVLIVIGLNRMGWRYRAQDDYRRLPGLAPLAVRNRLESLGMGMKGFAGAGLGGRKKPALLMDGLGSACLPVADLLILQAGKQAGPVVTPHRRKSRAAVAQSVSIST